MKPFILFSFALFLTTQAHASDSPCEDIAKSAAVAHACLGKFVYVSEEYPAQAALDVRYKIAVVDSIADAESYERFDIELLRSNCSIVSVVELQ